MESEKMETKYYKVLGEGLKNRNFQWKPGKWNEIPEKQINHNQDGNACGIGLHVFNGKPNWWYTSYLPDHTYRVVDVEGLLGKDEEKSRFRRVKLAYLPMSLTEILGEKRDGMKGADLTGADLTGAKLCRADLYNANLTDANLTDANLIRANLWCADLTDANLTDANLTDANLIDANLTDANLTYAHGCKNLDELSKIQKESAHC